MRYRLESLRAKEVSKLYSNLRMRAKRPWQGLISVRGLSIMRAGNAGSDPEVQGARRSRRIVPKRTWSPPFPQPKSRKKTRQPAKAAAASVKMTKVHRDAPRTARGHHHKAIKVCYRGRVQPAARDSLLALPDISRCHCPSRHSPWHRDHRPLLLSQLKPLRSLVPVNSCV